MPDLKKSLFIGGGFACVVLGLVGIILPVLPTTPFLLLAAFLFARSSDRALRWLLDNRWFGAYLRRYREGRGMALTDKIFTLLALWVTIGFTVGFVVNSIWGKLILVGVASAVSIHLARIRTYRRDGNPSGMGNAAEVEKPEC